MTEKGIVRPPQAVWILVPRRPRNVDLMVAEMNNAASIVVARILALANQDPEFRLALASVLDGLLDTKQAHVDDQAMAVEVSPPIAIDERQQTEPDGDADVVPAEQPAALPQVVATTIHRQPREAIQTDLSVIANRFRLKAEGARWAAERRRLIDEGMPFNTAIVPRDRELIARAKQLGCYLWTNGRNAPRPGNLDLFDVLGSCFEAAAEAVILLRDYAVQVKNKDLLKQCLDVAAEVQSALRSAVMAIGGPTDTEQQSLYDWLRKAAAKNDVFIERHLRVDDAADPYSWPDIRSRIQSVRETCQDALDRQRQRTDRVKRLRFHAKHITSGGGTDHDWQTIVKVVDEAVRDGVPPSNIEIRDALLPIIDSLPVSDGFPAAFQLVLRETEKYRARQDVETSGQNESVPTVETQAVRKFLNGTSLVIVGGDSRDHAHQAIKEAFSLKDVIWLDSREHQSTERFMPYITRADVKVVVLLIRWSSHSYGDLKQYCDRHRKHFVRMPAGYNPNQIANQVVAQCGHLLGKENEG